MKGENLKLTHREYKTHGILTREEPMRPVTGLESERLTPSWEQAQPTAEADQTPSYRVDMDCGNSVFSILSLTTKKHLRTSRES